jgi:hypothetical protein
MIKVSIVILNWNGLHFLRQFIPVLAEHSPPGISRIVVADNGSSDGSSEWLMENHPDIRLIILDHNHGYAGGYNLALDQIDTPFAVLLNSDVEVTQGWLEPLLEQMEDPAYASVMPKILAHGRRGSFEYAGAAGGWIDRFGYPFCRGRIFNVIEEDSGQFNSPEKVFWTSGACMMVRMKAFREAGGFDSSFFAHMEEIDLCWRMHALGFLAGYVPASTVYHVGGGTLPNESPRKIYLNFRNNLLLLHKNLPAGIKHRVLFLRKLFDTVAFLKFVAAGRIRFAASIITAHRDYYRMVSHSINQIPVVREPAHLPGWFNSSIVWEFFIRRRRKFAQLKV